MSLPDQSARDRIEDDLETSFVVEAGAGSGKTTALVGRLEQLLIRGRVSVDQVCAITFTRKAAGELRLRLRERLERVRREDADPQRASRAAEALQRLEGAAVGTIHGFAATILRERPLEAGLDPAFRVEDASLARLEGYCHEWLVNGLDRDDPLLRRYLVAHGGGEGALHYALRTLWEHRDLRAVGPGQGAWDRATFSLPLAARVRDLAAQIRPVLSRDSTTFARLEPLLNLGSLLTQDDELADLDRLEARLLGLQFEVFGKSRLMEPDAWSVEPDEARRLRAEAMALEDPLATYRRQATLDLAQRLIPALSRLLVDPDDPTCAASRLRRAGVLDSLGLLIEARDLVRDDLTVRRAFQRRFPVILVDELQDTDPLQLELIVLLAAPAYAGRDWLEALPQVEAGRLFLVGDPKQSIYRFRRADLKLYRELQQTLVETGAAERLLLTSNFRSRPGLARWVNAAFAEIFAARPEHQADYAPIEAQRPPSAHGPAVRWLSLGCKPYVREIRQAEPQVVADYLARSLRIEGVDPAEPLWVQDSPDSPERVAEPRDVAFLFKHMVSYGSDLTAAYVAALAERGIPAVLFSGSSFRNREEVDAAITVLRAVERPDDPIAVYGALKGPLFAIPEPELLADLSHSWRLDPRRPPATSLSAGLRQALEQLGQLHATRNHVPIARTIQRLYDGTRALTLQATLPYGARRVANLTKIQRLARDFDHERGEATSFRAFVARLQDLDAEADSPLAEEGRGGVRFLSLHKAKGLEFPIVYLADPTVTARKGFPIRRLYHREQGQVAVSLGDAPLPDVDVQDEIQAEVAEAERLLYVACTRARDVLVIPRVPNYRDTKYDRLALRLVPQLQAHCQLGAVLEVEPQPAHPRPSPHAPPPPTPADYLAWRGERERATARAAQPTHRVISVSARLEDEHPEAARAPSPPVQLELFPLHEQPAPPSAIAFPGREEAADFGTFVHLILSLVPLDADPATVRRYAQTLARRTPEVFPHLDAACTQVDWTLAQPLLDRARAASHTQRELPVSSLDPNGELLEGVIDLVFEDAAGLVVVDYKTGDPSPKHRDQLALYADLIGAPNAERWALYTRDEVARRVR